MNPKDLNPYYAYLREEARKARQARDLAMGQYIVDGLEGSARVLRSVVAGIFRLDVRRDHAWVESMETKLRQHQPY